MIYRKTRFTSCLVLDSEDAELGEKNRLMEVFRPKDVKSQAKAEPANPKEISETESKVFEVVKKYDFLENPKSFQKVLNSDTPEFKKVAKSLEENLIKLGMNLSNADGVIEQETLHAITSLISKNTQAIKEYKDLTGIDLLRNNTNSKHQR